MTGFEPAVDFAATAVQLMTSENKPKAVAANALHANGPSCRCLASFDSDLQVLISAWSEIPREVRRTILYLAIEGSAFNGISNSMERQGHDGGEAIDHAKAVEMPEL